MLSKKLALVAIFSCLLSLPFMLLASDGQPFNLHMTTSPIGFFVVFLFVLAYLLVMAEELTQLRKSKPVILAAGVIWVLIAWSVRNSPDSARVESAILQNILEYAELFLFLLVAMTYVNAMQERNVFESLRCWLIQKGFSYRQLFWITGLLAFFISPIADNLTTALLMCAVVVAIGTENPRFISIACVNIVVAVNAGGAFSPFGDITTLMVWQKGVVRVQDFLQIFFPSAVNFLVPALLMHCAIPKLRPNTNQIRVTLKPGALVIIVLFLLTITTAITFHNYLSLPPVAGMMTGLAYLQFFSYYLQLNHYKQLKNAKISKDVIPFDVFRKIERAEWDTLLFFYGIVLCVGGLATLGYLTALGDVLYNSSWGMSLSDAYAKTPANIALGGLSAVVDNIPIMFAVLTMNPSMSDGQWLLITLTAGTGGSLLSIGSAAGVALMGQSKGHYTFLSHLKWSWAVGLGYIASVSLHLFINTHLFHEKVIDGQLVPLLT